MSQKRKRTVVSYAQHNQLADLLSDNEYDITVLSGESSGDESENDDRTYSKNRKKPKKAPKKKRARHSPLPRQKAEKPFPFMELPPELRDIIYGMALTDERGILLRAKTKAYRRTVYRSSFDPSECWSFNWSDKVPADCRMVEPKELVPNLLAVSKQIHHEATNILYGQDLMFHDTDTLHRFLGVIGLRNQQRLLSLDIKNFGRGRISRSLNHCAFMSLVGATNLKALYLPIDDFRYYANAKGLARGLYCHAHFFFEAYGVAHGRKDAAIDIMQVDDYIFESFYGGYRKNIVVAKKPTAEENRTIFQAELRRLIGAK